MRHALFLLLFAPGLLAAAPALGQSSKASPEPEDWQQQQAEQQQTPAQPSQTRPAEAGHVADSAVGRVGQRQTRQDVPNLQPMGRISSRINNRVQSRIRNRIDRNYDPQANATSPFAVAEERTRSTNRRRQ